MIYRFWQIVRLCADEHKIHVARKLFVESGYMEQATWIDEFDSIVCSGNREKLDFDIGLNMCLTIAKELDKTFILDSDGQLRNAGKGQLLTLSECIQRFGLAVAEDCIEYGSIRVT